MAQEPPVDAAIGAHGHELRFLNEQWNDSISIGQPFILKWNRSLEKPRPQLALFKVRYPEDGTVVYDLVSNLPGPIDPMSYKWTPIYLGEKELYTMGLSDGQPAHPNWIVSPPWTPKVPEPEHGRHRAAAIVITSVCLLLVYAICLSIYLRRRCRNRGKEEEEEDAISDQYLSSTASTITVESLSGPNDGLKSKPTAWLITQSPGASIIITQEFLAGEEAAADIPISRTSTLLMHSSA